MSTSLLPRIDGSVSALVGACARRLDGHLCQRDDGHWPETYHRGLDPRSGQWTDYTEVAGVAIPVQQGPVDAVLDDGTEVTVDDPPTGRPFIPAFLPELGATLHAAVFLRAKTKRALAAEERLRIAMQLQAKAREFEMSDNPILRSYALGVWYASADVLGGTG